MEKIDDTYYLYYATVCNDCNPAVGMSVSDDLHHWNDPGPCFKRTLGWVPESPIVIRRADRFYLWIFPFQELIVSDEPANFHHAESVSPAIKAAARVSVS